MHTASMIKPTAFKKPQTVRVTVPVTLDVLDKFQRFSDASGLSVGKSMGDWLRDTMNGLDAMTQIMETHKRRPAQAISQLQSLASTLQTMTESTIETMKIDTPGVGAPLVGVGLQAREFIRQAAQTSLIPPASNTGGKVPRVNPNTKGV